MPLSLRHIVIAAAIATSAGIASAQEVTLRFQHFISPKGAVPAHFMAPWAEKIQADSGGRIEVQSAQKVKTFTVRFEDATYDESPIAMRIHQRWKASCSAACHQG